VLVAKYLIRKLENFAKLSPEEKRALEEAAALRTRAVPAREDIIFEGDRPSHVNLILEGFACRYKMLEDGRRQIVAVLVPGDMCDLRMFILKEMDHSIASLSAVKLAEVPEDRLLEITENSARLTRALWWNSLVDEAIAREWTVNVGRRDATERMAHLLCELFVRLRAVGLTNGSSCDMPVTQAELGDALGLSHVHTNRTLQELRGRGLITLKGKELVIHDLDRLKDVAMFNSNYLHLGHEGRHLDSNQR
jgi:CRP-like cAMP-binding protein